MQVISASQNTHKRSKIRAEQLNVKWIISLGVIWLIEDISSVSEPKHSNTNNKAHDHKHENDSKCVKFNKETKLPDCSQPH